jgi:phosphoenolpyruvate carboxykinase (GTP)
MQRRLHEPPPIFLVNWFRKDADGKFLWPGYGENMRVLKWILDRAHARTGAAETPIGFVPREGDLDLKGLDVAPERVRQATAIDPSEWATELESQRELFDKLARTVPRAITLQRELLAAKL